MRFEGKTCLVTGGAGFLGGHLIDSLLSEGAKRVSIVGNISPDDAFNKHGSHIEIYRENAGDISAMTAVVEIEKPDIIFNLATKPLMYSYFNPSGAFKISMDIASTLAELLRKGTYKKLVHFSSSEVYGASKIIPISESHPFLSETTYSAGKASGDLLLSSYVNMFGLNIVIVRPFSNYGPRQNSGKFAALIPATIQKILTGEAPVLSGDGAQTRDFTFVKDTIEAVIKISTDEELNGQILNIGSGKEISIKEVVELLCQIMEFTGEIKYIPARNTDVMRYCADTTKTQELIGEISTTPLINGLRETVEWYINNQPDGRE